MSKKASHEHQNSPKKEILKPLIEHLEDYIPDKNLIRTLIQRGKLDTDKKITKTEFLNRMKKITRLNANHKEIESLAGINKILTEVEKLYISKNPIRAEVINLRNLRKLVVIKIDDALQENLITIKVSRKKHIKISTQNSVVEIIG